MLHTLHCFAHATLFRTHYKQPTKIQHFNVSALFNENNNLRSSICQQTARVNRGTPCCDYAGVRLLSMARAAKVHHHMAQLLAQCSHTYQQWATFIRGVSIDIDIKLSHAQWQQHKLSTTAWNLFLEENWFGSYCSSSQDIPIDAV